ncbi:hypothetical protein V1477_020670 [Vespula maculifrons]|uniref:Uncharacterized protein n=1 Tax=Vespula maculifrons TaxID=7453 RepID=A0ABD2AQC0_VESMC
MTHILFIILTIKGIANSCELKLIILYNICVKILLLERNNFLKPYPTLFVAQMAHGTEIVEIIYINRQSGTATVCRLLEDEPSKRDDRKNLLVKNFETDR